ncbi:MAG TPA: hypothetical protein VG389_13410 [Myxococcota bacterium]|jgi:hypothetical protein|nr:hypothetical protein [Myxococcota bacterium]
MAKRHPRAAQLRLCVERILPADMKVAAARRAIAINPSNDPLPAIRKAGLVGATVHPLKMALIAGKKWRAKGETLRVRFMDGSKTQRAKVRKQAEEWLSYANVKFNWKGGAQAEIRISFEADDGSWSAVGTDCLHTEYFKKSEPTMNFGWLRDDTDDVEYRRVVVHEFGHALGAIHEHQNPKGGIVWNEQAVIAAFSGPPNNWSAEDILSNVIDKYSLDQLNATSFDPKSIMLYAFPRDLIKGPPSLAKKGTQENTDLSAKDKTFIGKMYPKGA